MLSLDPIRPYLWAIKAGATAVVAMTLFVQGCQHGQRKQAQSTAKQLAAKDADLLKASAALRGAADALHVVSAETKAAEAAAAAQAQQAKSAVDAARARAKTLAAQLAAAEQALEEAKAADPNCRKLLETPSCAAFR